MFNSQWKKELINKGCWDLLGAALHFPSIPSFPAAGDEGKKRLPSGYLKIAIENGQLWWIFPLKVVIFHNCVSLPEGKHRKAMIQLRMTRFPVINHTLRILRTSPANSVLPNQSTGLFFNFFVLNAATGSPTWQSPTSSSATPLAHSPTVPGWMPCWTPAKAMRNWRRGTGGWVGI